MSEEVLTEKDGEIFTVTINRPEVKNAVNGPTAKKLAKAFRKFDEDENLKVAIFRGAGETFCSGADLEAVQDLSSDEANPLHKDMSKMGPMGPTRMDLSKPVIAVISGYAVAGGLELACWCDLRVMEEDAVIGFFNRRWGVPLIDGGSQRLPRLIGMSNALDLILTGREVGAAEAKEMGFANRVVEEGKGREKAEEIASKISDFPQNCLLKDRDSVYRGFDLDLEEGLKIEFENGLEVIETGEPEEGASEFSNREEE